jgi:hypothetical protein
MDMPVNAFDRIAERFGCSIAIVPYEPKYLAGTLEVAREIHAHSIYSNLPLDNKKLIEQLSMSGNGSPDRWFRLAVRNDEVLGGFYGCVSKTFFSESLLARDMGWWVKQSARGGAAAILLLREFELWAKNSGANICMVGQSVRIDVERTFKLFAHCGYVCTGFNTAKAL